MVGTAYPPDLEYPKNEDRISYTSSYVHWHKTNPIPNYLVVFEPIQI